MNKQTALIVEDNLDDSVLYVSRSMVKSIQKIVKQETGVQLDDFTVTCAALVVHNYAGVTGDSLKKGILSMFQGIYEGGDW